MTTTEDTAQNGTELERSDEVKHILIHIVVPVYGSMGAYGMITPESQSVAEATLLLFAGAALLFYGFNQTIELADKRLNGTGAIQNE